MAGGAQEESPEARLARASIESWVRDRRRISARELQEEEKLLKEKGAAFVCIKKHGDLRGCIGTFRPTRDNLAEEIANNAISAACRDPRFPPVSREELADLQVSVDVLSEPESVPDASYLDPKKYGVIVEAGGRLGLLLPDLEGVDTVDQQLEIARNKAGIRPGEPVQLYRFTVKRYE
jgi:hypothetical protein